MPQKERLRVFLGELKKTSGGLTKKDLIQNKRGKIVSRRKSGQATSAANNLGSWLRSKGDKFAGKPKGFKEEQNDDDEKLGEVPEKKKKAVVKPVGPKKKAVVKAVGPKVGPKKKAVVKPVGPKKPVVKKKKLEPMKPGEEKNLAKVSVGNIIIDKTAVEKYELSYAYNKFKRGWDKKKILDKMGPLPVGFKEPTKYPPK